MSIQNQPQLDWNIWETLISQVLLVEFDTWLNIEYNIRRPPTSDGLIWPESSLHVNIC